VSCRVKHALVTVFLLLLAFVGLTWWALESSGVAVLETQRPDGSTRSTHVWHVTHNGELWLEAGTPENAWFQDVEGSPRVLLRLEGRSTEYLAEPIRESSGHTTIRSLLREKYGVRDWWVALLFDTSRSVAVRLLPQTQGSGG
jgi:hypothetical protein